tara:strand:- start:137 stop:373 length:237 start_codon:yes stop_codon:yes gene_type:complete
MPYSVYSYSVEGFIDNNPATSATSPFTTEPTYGEDLIVAREKALSVFQERVERGDVEVTLWERDSCGMNRLIKEVCNG